MTGATGRSVACPDFPTGLGACKCGCGMQLHDKTILSLQAFLAALARYYSAPVHLDMTSGARCAKHNAETPGSAPDSQHVGGFAVDGYFAYLMPSGWHRIDSREVSAIAVRSGLFGGVGWMRYGKDSGIIHLDIRTGHTVTW